MDPYAEHPNPTPMSYFGKSLTSKKIVVRKEATSSDDSQMLKRLERIEINYSKLADVLSELEEQFELDDRLAAIFGEDSVDQDAVDKPPKKPR